jgi:hypothetical protein
MLTSDSALGVRTGIILLGHGGSAAAGVGGLSRLSVGRLVGLAAPPASRTDVGAYTHVLADETSSTTPTPC